ncbi:MAG: hypothetical protein JRJ65_19265 [Deltaproteobacteria bacterium]|nr:hypothetical protein [Deltaproteobacteria bacterium]
MKKSHNYTGLPAFGGAVGDQGSRFGASPFGLRPHKQGFTVHGWRVMKIESRPGKDIET